MRALAGLAVLLVLGGCAEPQGADRVAWDAANCRRHALEGPGGPSQVVGSSFGSSSPARSSRRNNTAAGAASAMLSPRDRDPALQTASAKESVYWDCMRVRGHAITAPGRPLDPDRIGALPQILL
jgi:hypothetical protein